MDKEKKALLLEAITWYLRFRKSEDTHFKYDLKDIIYEISDDAELELSDDMIDELAADFFDVI